MPALLHEGPRRLDGTLDRLGQVNALFPQCDAALSDTRHVEQVVDQPGELLRLTARDLQGAVPPGLVEPGRCHRVLHGGERVP